MMRRMAAWLVAIVVVAAAGAWFVLLRPQVIGGPAAYILVAGRSMEPTIHEGSLAVAIRQASYEVGDVVVYTVPGGSPAAGRHVIHRIVGGTAKDGFVTQGDNADGSDLWRPREGDIVGRAEIVVPGATPALLVARSPIVAASVAAAFATYLVLGMWAPNRRPVVRQDGLPRGEWQPSRIARFE